MTAADAFVALVRQVATEALREELAPVLATLETGPADQGERLLTVRHAAERADVGETTMRRWIDGGLVPVVQLPGRVQGSTERRVRQADLDSFIRSLAGDRDEHRQPKTRRTARAPTTTRGSSRQPESLSTLVRRRIQQQSGTATSG